MQFSQPSLLCEWFPWSLFSLNLIKHINFLSNILHLQASQYQEKNIIKFAIYLWKVLQRHKISVASLLHPKFSSHQFWVLMTTSKNFIHALPSALINFCLSPLCKGYLSHHVTQVITNECRVSEKGEKNRKNVLSNRITTHIEKHIPGIDFPF